MKASEVTESGFYWWKAPEFSGHELVGWQPIRIVAEEDQIYGYVLGASQFCWRRSDLDADVIGPLRTPSEDRSAALTRWSKSRLDRIHALLGISQDMDSLNKGDGNEKG